MNEKATERFTSEQTEVLQAISRVLNREAHVLTQHPDLLWQQMYNRLQWDGDAVVEELKPELQERSRPGTRPWLKCNTPFRESQSLLRTIQTPTFKIISCAFSPEGDTILAGDEDGTIRIFQTSTGKQVHRIEVKNNVKAYHFSPDGQTIKAVCQDGLFQVWETASGRQLFTSNVLSDIKVSAFSQDGRLLLTYHKDKALILWNAETGEYLSVLANEAGYVNACSCSPDGRLIATIGSLGLGSGYQLCVWNAVTREQLYCSDKHYGFETCNFSPDGQLLVTDSAILDAKTGRLVHRLRGHNEFVSSCVFSPDGRFIASAGFSDKTVRIWSVETGQLFCTFTGHTSAVMACAFSPDGRKVLSASMDKTLRIWNIPGEPMQEADEEIIRGILSCGFSPDGKLIACGFGHGELVLIDGDTGEHLRSIDNTSNPVTSCVFSPDSQYIACAGQDWVMEVRDTKTGEEIITFDLDADTKTLDCAFSPDGKYLIAPEKGFEILIWDFVSKQKDVLRKFEAHKGQVNCCKFSPDGLWVASGDWDSNLLIWNVTTGNVVHKLVEQTVSVICCSFSPDGKRIVSGNSNGSLKIWAMDSGDLIQSLEAHANNVSECAFSPDGSLVFSSGEDTFLKVYDANSFNLLAQFPFSGQLVSLGLHPFEPKLVCGDDNGTLSKVELMGIDYRPIFVTPIINNGHLLVRCPACQQEHKLERPQLGKILTCHTPGCGLRLKINTFILGGQIKQVQAIATSDDIDWLRDQVHIHQEKGDLEKALEAADRILELQKNDPFANHTRMSLLMQLGRFDEAMAIGDRCIQLGIIDRKNPSRTFILMGMAIAGNQKFGPQRYEAALEYFKTALNYEQTSQAWLQHGMAHANMGRPELAIESYMKARALQITTEKNQVDLAIGFTYLQLENASMAELEFRNTLADGNKDPLAYFGLGLALVLSGEGRKSLQWFKSFLQHAGPEHQDYVAQAKLIVDKLSE